MPQYLPNLYAILVRNITWPGSVVSEFLRIPSLRVWESNRLEIKDVEDLEFDPASLSLRHLRIKMEAKEGEEGDREGDEETGKTSTEAEGQVKECPVAVVTREQISRPCVHPVAN